MGILHRVPELACTRCKGELVENRGLFCRACDISYPVAEGIPDMLVGDELAELAEEITTQDRVAVEYEQVRYRDPVAVRYHRWWTDQMLARVDTGGRILDNGCGVGLLCDRIAPEQVVGLDISREMLRHAATLSNQLILGNSQDLPLHSGSFDVAFCRSLLHHLPDAAAAVREMHRVLRPGGEMVIVDTNRSLLSWLPRFIASRGEHFSHDHQNLCLRRIRALLEPFFTIEDVLYFGYLAYPLLGFPDLVHLFKYLPCKTLAETALMRIDALLSRTPGVRTQSWAILVKAGRCDLDSGGHGVSVRTPHNPRQRSREKERCNQSLRCSDRHRLGLGGCIQYLMHLAAR
jgi:ubiquinone/menaquinone biosynthesis C-methylase UbiE